MQVNPEIDILERDIADYSSLLLHIILLDHTTGRNIIWATEDYVQFGEEYGAKKSIEATQITGNYSKVIQPRITKAQTDQISRTRDKAEVFTPSWICNAQNNLIDEAWFGRKNIFNTPRGTSWVAKTKPIVFPNKKGCTWQKYVDAKRMEISCGEAPYLVSRYDTTTGKIIALPSRIGLLDRKLRIVNENTDEESEWFKWTKRAFQSVYAYEFQGDNLLLARENLLYTFIDNVRFKLQRDPTIHELESIATIISWNLWQMDGMTYTIPYGEVKEDSNQLSLFDEGYINGSMEPQNEVFAKLCLIKDWRSKVILEYKSLVKEARP